MRARIARERRPASRQAVNGVLYSWHKGLVPHIAFNASWAANTVGRASVVRGASGATSRVACPRLAARPVPSDRRAAA